MNVKVSFETQLPCYLAKHKVNNGKSKSQTNEINDIMSAY